MQICYNAVAATAADTGHSGIRYSAMLMPVAYGIQLRHTASYIDIHLCASGFVDSNYIRRGLLLRSEYGTGRIR